MITTAPDKSKGWEFIEKFPTNFLGKYGYDTSNKSLKLVFNSPNIAVQLITHDVPSRIPPIATSLYTAQTRPSPCGNCGIYELSNIYQLNILIHLILMNILSQK